MAAKHFLGTKSLVEVVDCRKFLGTIETLHEDRCRSFRHASRQVTILYDIKSKPSAICAHLIMQAHKYLDLQVVGSSVSALEDPRRTSRAEA
jgi:hypothetical protein